MKEVTVDAELVFEWEDGQYSFVALRLSPGAEPPVELPHHFLALKENHVVMGPSEGSFYALEQAPLSKLEADLTESRHIRDAEVGDPTE